MQAYDFPYKQFQSTPPVKAATQYTANLRCLSAISIHAAREGGDYNDDKQITELHIISIHAAREGGDAIAILPSATSSISIHAAREGGDGQFGMELCCHNDFNPRRP